MKKLLTLLLVTTTQIFPQDSMFTRWHQGIMDRWNALSEMHKMILGALGVIAAIWILCRLMSCRGSKCCGCAGACTCSK